jgi:hypothetical protein
MAKPKPLKLEMHPVDPTRELTIGEMFYRVVLALNGTVELHPVLLVSLPSAPGTSDMIIREGNRDFIGTKTEILEGLFEPQLFQVKSIKKN